MSSSRRAAAGDDNILARLERDARRSKSGKKSWNHAPLAWCLLASAAVIALVGTLASLTRENLAVNRAPVLIDARATPPEVSGPSAAAIVKGGFAPLPVPDLKLAAAAADKPPEPVRPPPMVMLKPAPEASAKPVAARTSPPKPAAKAVQAKPAPSVKPAPAARAQAKTVVPKPAPVRPVLAAAPPRPKKAAPAPATAAPEPAAIDSDVALLSAIIMHASRHAAERAQQEAARCGAGRKCAPRDDPLTTTLKATD